MNTQMNTQVNTMNPRKRRYVETGFEREEKEFNGFNNHFHQLSQSYPQAPRSTDTKFNWDSVSEPSPNNYNIFQVPYHPSINSSQPSLMKQPNYVEINNEDWGEEGVDWEWEEYDSYEEGEA